MEIDTTHNHGSSRSGRRKSILICQACGHESPVRGDWTWEIAGDDVVVTCPNCGHELTRRPAADAPAERKRAQTRC